MFRSCAVGIWAVRRGSPLSENDGPLACSMVKLCSFCWIMYVAVGSDIATSWRHCGIPLIRCLCSECMRMISCLYVHCARGLRMCGPRESLALCHVHGSFLHTHVDHHVVWHNISTLCFSMSLFAFSWLRCSAL